MSKPLNERLRQKKVHVTSSTKDYANKLVTMMVGGMCVSTAGTNVASLRHTQEITALGTSKARSD